MAHRITAVGQSDSIDQETVDWLTNHGYTDITTTFTLSLPSSDYVHLPHANIGKREFLNMLERATHICYVGKGQGISIQEGAVRRDGDDLFVAYQSPYLRNGFAFGKTNIHTFVAAAKDQHRIGGVFYALLLRTNSIASERNLTYEEAAEKIGWYWRHPENDNVSPAASTSS